MCGLGLVWVLLERGYYSREGVTWGNTVCMHAMKKTINHKKVCREERKFFSRILDLFQAISWPLFETCKSFAGLAKKRGENVAFSLMVKKLQCHSSPRPIEKGFNPCALQKQAWTGQMLLAKNCPATSFVITIICNFWKMALEWLMHMFEKMRQKCTLKPLRSKLLHY